MKLSRHIPSPRFDLFADFDEFFNRAFGRPLAVDRSATPSDFGVHESDDAWILRTDLPGFEKPDVKVSLADGAVTVHAKREDDDRKFYSELRHSFRVPADVDATRVEARLDHGVLELVLPKCEEAKPKALEIEVN